MIYGATRPSFTPPLYLGSLAVGVALALALAGCKRAAPASAGEGPPLTPGAVLHVERRSALYVTNNGSDSVSVVDRDRDAVTAVPVDVDPDAHEAPHHLAIDADKGSLFVALAFPPKVTGNTKTTAHGSHGGSSDVGKLARLDLSNLSVRATVDVDENPGDVILTHDRTRLLVTHFDMKRAMDVAARGGASPATMFAELVVLDARTLKRVGARALCTAPHGVTTTKDDRWAFVACYGSDELAVVDLGDGALASTRLPLGAAPGVPGVPRYGPYGATLSPDDALVVVSDLEGQDVRVFDRSEKRFLTDRAVPLAAKAFMPAFVDERVVLVPVQAPDGLVRVDVGSGRVTNRIAFDKATCALPHVVRVAKDRRTYLVCEGDHVAPGAVLEIDPSTLAVKRRWTVGVYPDGIEFGE
jgi:DNA-binding beta-propeller fold protein YncE